MPRSYDSATVELAMTLSTLAYVDENRTATQQQMINEINAETAVAGKHCQRGELAMGSAIALSGTIIMPFGAHRGRVEPNAFENALFLWEAAQQHACTMYQALLQTPIMLPAVGRLKQALAAMER